MPLGDTVSGPFRGIVPVRDRCIRKVPPLSCQLSGVFFGMPLLATAALAASLTMLNVVESRSGVTDCPTTQTPSSCCGSGVDDFDHG
jgi:hypothetical protein